MARGEMLPTISPRRPDAKRSIGSVHADSVISTTRATRVLPNVPLSARSEPDATTGPKPPLTARLSRVRPAQIYPPGSARSEQAASAGTGPSGLPPAFKRSSVTFQEISDKKKEISDGQLEVPGSPDYADILIKVMDRSDISVDSCNQELLPFMQQVGNSDSHFLEGLLGELHHQGTDSLKPEPPLLPRRSLHKLPVDCYSSRQRPTVCSELSRRGRTGGSVSGRLSTMGLPRGSVMPGESQEDAHDAPSPRRSNFRRSTARISEGTEDVQPPLAGEKRSSSISRLSVLFSAPDSTRERGAKALMRQQEACESLRILVFGVIGNENWRQSEKSRIFEQSKGTVDEVNKFAEVWSHIDEDNSGDIDFGEFLEFFAKTKADRLLCMRCVKYLLGMSGSSSDANISNFSRKTSSAKCTREEMMRLLWLKATPEDVEMMMEVFDLHMIRSASVAAPPLLPKKKRRELVDNFTYLDREGRGLITYSDLLDGGLVDAQLMHEMRAKYDHSGRGVLDQNDFLEMVSPFGCRAHEGVKEMVNKDGKLIHLVRIDSVQMGVGQEKFEGWLLDSDLQRLTQDTTLKVQYGRN